ncbi:CUB and zona pellucida-like domain-containing protein 1 [Myripristis murdjan]|uniref:CUB and zona pellucida-like domain-containing protein 1 n=1 Tax=Myripristis murdjan TaxID=586833 RepID=UPI001175D13B|nr:CUB and zona pellucida-like domain-containing protein 1 [Myripristis murdjan]
MDLDPTATTVTTTAAPITTTTRLSSSSGPLTKLPLQFSVLVDAPAPSCRVGDYLPQFLHPTPANGERLHAEANKEVEIRVKAQANYATLEGIIISGPLRVTKHRTTHNKFAIRWTPATDDVGDHFPICFAAEAKAGSRVYQSEMRCVLVDVVQDSVKTNVICQESTMTVEVERASLSGIRVDHLRLNDPSNTVCSLQSHSNSTHIVAVIPLNSCGTQIEEDDDNLFFKNEITTTDDVNTLITRKHLLEVEFYCQYPKRGNVTLGFTAHRSNVTVWEKGFGTFTYEFEFFHGSSFQRMMDPSSYPLLYDVGERIYMQIEAISSINNTELFVESCRAAPYDNPNYTPTYSIIENGCEVDATTQIHSPNHQNHFSFSMETFKFIGQHDQVYISCSVMVCEAGNPSTRCSQGCINSTSPQSYSHHRGKREAVIQTAKHFVSQGPLRLRSSESTATNLNLNLNLVFIAGCLLAAVGMICAVIIYKSKASKIKYQPLPSFEN